MHVHENNGKKIGWTIALNLIITVAEYLGGIFSGSLALISDAGHNLSDVLSLILSYLGERISEKKATKNHSFGFKRVEIFTALINAISLWVIGIIIISEAFKRLNGHESISLRLMLGIAVIGLFGNIFSMMVLNKSRNSNLNMKAAYTHLLYDATSSFAVIISAITIYFTKWYFLDTLVSVFIALMIFWSGFGILKSAVHILIQGVPEGIDFEEVYKTIQCVKGVESVHSIHIWSINSKEMFLSCHICADKMEIDTDKIIIDINNILDKKYGIHHTTIQIERIKICDSGTVCFK